MLLRHARVIDDLQQQVAQLVLEAGEVAARDGVGHLVGFLQRIGRDGAEGLFEVPGTAAAGRAQRGHDLDQPGNIAGGFHRMEGSLRREAVTVAKPAKTCDCGHLIRIRHIMEYLDTPRISPTLRNAPIHLKNLGYS